MGWEKLKIALEVAMEANADGEPEVFVGKTSGPGANTSGNQQANWGKWAQGHQDHQFPIELGVWVGRN